MSSVLNQKIPLLSLVFVPVYVIPNFHATLFSVFFPVGIVARVWSCVLYLDGDFFMLHSPGFSFVLSFLVLCVCLSVRLICRSGTGPVRFFCVPPSVLLLPSSRRSSDALSVDSFRHVALSDYLFICRCSCLPCCMSVCWLWMGAFICRANLLRNISICIPYF